MSWDLPQTFDATNTSAWVHKTLERSSVPDYRPDFADNEDFKKAYGIALGKGLDAFNAAMDIFNQELPKALWVSIHWIKDPIVIANKDIYLRSLKQAEKPLDKTELLAEILSTSRKCLEDKDRVAALKLYAEVSGFTGPKVAIDASNNSNNNITNNTTKIVLVKGSSDGPKTIDQPVNNNQSKISNNALPNLKLVGGSR